MRTYHPASWSQQARELADIQFRQFVYYTENPEAWTDELSKEFDFATGSYVYLTPKQSCIRFLQKSYRHKLIRERAAARFGRKVREYYKKRGIN